MGLTLSTPGLVVCYDSAHSTFIWKQFVYTQMSLKSELYLEDAGGKASTLEPIVKHQDLGTIVFHLLADLVHLKVKKL